MRHKESEKTDQATPTSRLVRLATMPSLTKDKSQLGLSSGKHHRIYSFLEGSIVWRQAGVTLLSGQMYPSGVSPRTSSKRFEVQLCGVSEIVLCLNKKINKWIWNHLEKKCKMLPSPVLLWNNDWCHIILWERTGDCFCRKKTQQSSWG